MLLGNLNDKVLVALVTLADGLLKRDDEETVDLISLVQQKELGDVGVLDLEVVLVPVHAKEGVEQVKAVPAAGGQEGGLLKLGNGGPGRLLNVFIAHDRRHQDLRLGVDSLVGRVDIGVGGDVEADLDKLVRVFLKSVGLVELELNLVPVVSGHHTLGHLSKVKRHNLLTGDGVLIIIGQDTL